MPVTRKSSRSRPRHEMSYRKLTHRQGNHYGTLVDTCLQTELLEFCNTQICGKFTQDTMYQILSESVEICRRYNNEHFLWRVCTFLKTRNAVRHNENIAYIILGLRRRVRVGDQERLDALKRWCENRRVCVSSGRSTQQMSPSSSH